MVRVAINGFGRIGRTVLKICLEKGIDVVAINDIHGIGDARYLMQFDSIYGKYEKKVSFEKDDLIVGKKKIKVICEKEIDKLPWKKLKIDVVVEATGVFRDPKIASKHIRVGAKRVIITAPCKDNRPDATIVFGVNDNLLTKEKKIISAASCTTNCLVPLVKVLHNDFKIKRALMTTVHAYTNDQSIQDEAHKKQRRGRAGAINIIPTTTGAAESVVEVMPELLGKINGLAVRVPVEVGSLVDIVAEVEGSFSVEEINKALEKSSKGKLKGIMSYSTEELVSSDIKKDSHSCIIDSLSTQVNGNLIKVLAWYDNEYGYSSRVVDIIEKIGKFKS